eukprot:Cvel_12083.t1-p1 / transcript=Cvel_12083.t1 / gene=Cvel_12083 / organism=Chromera_velia_CCMP2878 / gene_product=hypothetical protein / transcript_product=hypothetical protein / location=Cvel_scaffold777:65282-66843(+) / protein_length=149 / sequence_SO=supercontig / SO=protein_coding / is_pseudo=false
MASAGSSAALKKAATQSLDKEYDEDELQRKLREAGKNSQVFQMQIKSLQGNVVKLRKDRAAAIEKIDKRKKELAEVEHKISVIENKRRPLEEKLARDSARRDELAKSLAEWKAHFDTIAKLTKKSAEATLRGTANTNKALTAQNLEAER